MRSLLLTALFTGSPLALAGSYGMAGCGAGSVIFTSLDRGPQVFAATTNSSSASQFFGISSGTSNCTENAAEVAVLSQDHFTVVHLSALSKDIARGAGPALSGLAALYGCSDGAAGEFAQTLQRAAGDIFSAPGGVAVSSAIRGTLLASGSLRASCALVGVS